MLQVADQIADRNVPGMARQTVSATTTDSALQEIVLPKGGKNSFEKLSRKLLPAGGKIPSLDIFVRFQPGELDDRPQSIFCLLG
jgi:hypothetical protein